MEREYVGIACTIMAFGILFFVPGIFGWIGFIVCLLIAFAMIYSKDWSHKGSIAKHPPLTKKYN